MKRGTDVSRSGSDAKPIAGGIWRAVILVAVVVGLTVLWPLLGLGEVFSNVREWVVSFGILAPIVFVLVYALAVVLLVPAAAMTVAAGGLFGPWLGILVAAVGANLGSALAFVIARTIAREPMREWLSGREGARRIDDLVARHGSLTVAFVRLVPVFPFNLTCYVFGLTGVPFSSYVLWTALASLPGTVLYVVGSAAVVEAVATRSAPLGLIVVFVITLVAIVLLGRYAKHRMGNDGP